MNAVFQLIKRAFRQETALHPVDRKVAKRWIKRRLTLLFPELRNNHEALERAYLSLGLEPRPGGGEGEPETVFEMKLPDGVEPRTPIVEPIAPSLFASRLAARFLKPSTA